MRAAWMLVVFGIWLALSGCTTEPELAKCEGSYRPVGLSDDDLSDVHEAFLRFSRWSGAKAELSLHGKCEVTRQETVDPQIGYVGAQYYPDTGEIRIGLHAIQKECADPNPDNPEAYHHCIQSVIMHEIGHSFGFDHVDHSRSGIMRHPWIDVTDFTEADREECARHNLCRTISSSPAETNE